MAVYRVEVAARSESGQPAGDPHLRALLRRAGLPELADITASRLFFFEGELTRVDAERLADALLRDPVTEQAAVLGAGDPAPAPSSGKIALEVHPRPGVMDPVAESTRAELAAAGEPVQIVRTGRRYVLSGAADEGTVIQTARRVLANDCVEELVVGTAGVRPAPWPPVFEFKLRSVPLRDLDAKALEQLSRAAHLFLSLDEMLAIQQHFRTMGREPTDLEIETIAQTWSEHCVHKTLRSAVAYQGAPLPGPDGAARARSRTKSATSTARYDNLLKDTIVRATEELIATRRGPACLSVFKDNAGVIAFDDEYAVAFKVETHNHPSAIEPYGGAATGIGGVIRDVIGCGLGAKPIANTDVFCVAPSDWPYDALPKGVLHPRRVLEGIVAGVADYGNRMGIPTVNGAVYFDPRYLGNPLVYCGCLGLIPRRLVDKAARPGDRIVVIGGRTGRDGIHGATFSSAELTDTHADEFSHAVQIGNAITEKCFLDAVLQARDAEGGCLYTAITDCGAGGLSSAVGEMGEEIGAVVELEKVPLKYAGLRYDEIWISEAQERMVVAVPPECLARFMDIMAAEGVEATVIGVFGNPPPPADDAKKLAPSAEGPRLVLRFDGQQVGDLDLRFLHKGLPQRERVAEWSPGAPPPAARKRGAARRPEELVARLVAELRRPNVAAKTWIIRRYDHEVQGGSVVKPLLGPGGGPGDAAVLRPRLDSKRGVALGCGLAPHVADLDPYWMAVAAIDEALRNVVCVGGDPSQTALLDNFCWARSDDPQQLGALVRACQACHDVALANGTPFISGKDSLNNEFALDAGDIDRLIETLHAHAAGTDVEAERLRAILPALEERLRERRRLAIPPTLLISALSIVPDVRRCVTPDLKRPGARVLLVGGLPLAGHAPADAAAVHRAVAALIAAGQAAACHDVSDGGWLVALAEMAFTGGLGVDIDEGAAARLAPFEECCAAYLVEAADLAGARAALHGADVVFGEIGTVRSDDLLCWKDARVALATLRAAWRGEETAF